MSCFLFLSNTDDPKLFAVRRRVIFVWEYMRDCYEDGIMKDRGRSGSELRKHIIQVDKRIVDGIDVVDDGTHTGKDVGNVAERFADVQDGRP